MTRRPSSSPSRTSETSRAFSTFPIRSYPKTLALFSPSKGRATDAADDDDNNKKREKGRKPPIFAPLNRVAREIGGALCLVNDRRRRLTGPALGYFWQLEQ